MSLESAAIALARGAASVTALVPAASIHIAEAPQGLDAPFIFFVRVSTAPQNTLDEGTAGTRAQMDNIQLQAACYGRTGAESLAIAAALRRVFTNEAALSAWCVGQEESGEEEPQLRGQILTFSCWYATDVAAL